MNLREGLRVAGTVAKTREAVRCSFAATSWGSSVPFAFITLMAVSVFGSSTGVQDGMFSASDAYERFMGRWSRELALLLVRFAGVRDGDAVFDVGSGTGALAAAVVVVASSSRVIGIDPAASYVDLARRRHAGDLVRFEVGDAQQL